MDKINNEIIINPHLNTITSDVLSQYWVKNKDYIIYNFALRLYQYAAGKTFDTSIHKTSSILPQDLKQRLEITGKIRMVRRTSSRAKQFQRLLIGYYGLFENLTPHKCNLSSKKANLEDSSKTVADHVIGVTSIGEYTIKEFQKKYLKVKPNVAWPEFDDIYIKKSIEKMCYEWLPKHLWLWAQCRITKEEHKSSNLERGTNMKISDKKKLYHYNKAKILVENYK